MTLDQYLAAQQELTQNVLVERCEFKVNPETRSLERVCRLVEEYHPINPDSLPILKKVWTLQYDTWQLHEMHRSKQESTMAISVQKAQPIELNGEVSTIPDFAERYGINLNTVYQRIHDGWSVERAITEPLKRSRS